MASLQDDAAPATNGAIPAEPQTKQELSQPSQTASDYINSQLRLESDAREILPFSFDHCTKDLGPLRQNLFSCLTCNPPPKSADEKFTPAAVCYSCSIACHGEHTLVELFHRRDFVCDCGTTRFPASSPCTLRIDPATGMKGPVHSQLAAPGNSYNQNARNRFCDCHEWYEAEKEKGTMFQCLGLASEEEGGCGEDWWHPECVVWGGKEGKKRRTEADDTRKAKYEASQIKQDGAEQEEEEEENELPPGFPNEEEFDTFICWKCVEAVPLLKRYAGTEGFLPAVFLRESAATENGLTTNDKPLGARTAPAPETKAEINRTTPAEATPSTAETRKKRTASDADLEATDAASTTSKKPKADSNLAPTTTNGAHPAAYHTTLPPPPPSKLSLFSTSQFRTSLCRCSTCYPLLQPHPQLLEEEEIYEPPVSETNDAQHHTSGSVGSKSILEMGEEALSNVDRVRAIEGVMAYNHLKDKVKGFLKPFAESGQPVGAEDIKAYFEKLRGDEMAVRDAKGKPQAGGGGGEDGEGGSGEGNGRREQSGY